MLDTHRTTCKILIFWIDVKNFFEMTWTRSRVKVIPLVTMEVQQLKLCFKITFDTICNLICCVKVRSHMIKIVILTYLERIVFTTPMYFFTGNDFYIICNKTGSFSILFIEIAINSILQSLIIESRGFLQWWAMFNLDFLRTSRH